MSQRGGFCGVCCPQKCWGRAVLGCERLAPLIFLMVLGPWAPAGGCELLAWVCREQHLCHAAFGPVLSAWQRAVVLQARVPLLSPCLCSAQAASPFCLRDKPTP